MTDPAVVGLCRGRAGALSRGVKRKLCSGLIRAVRVGVGANGAFAASFE